MIRALRRLLRRARPLSSETMLANLERGHAPEDDNLDPDDPIVRLVTQAKAVNNGAITLYINGDTNTCPTCLQDTQQHVYAHSESVAPEYAIHIANHCPNCPPEGDDE